MSGVVQFIGSRSGYAITSVPDSHFEVGRLYFLRTVTMYYVGECVSLNDREVVLTKASWIPDTGRFSECLANGTFERVEPYPVESEVIVNRDVIVDAVEWAHELPTVAQ